MLSTGLSKVNIYMSYVVSKLMYSLETLWLLKHERAKLDAFHHRCLRKVLGIPSSYISRVPNADVLDAAGVPLLSDLLCRRQTCLYRKISQQHAGSYANNLCAQSRVILGHGTGSGGEDVRGKCGQQVSTSLWHDVSNYLPYICIIFFM